MPPSKVNDVRVWIIEALARDQEPRTQMIRPDAARRCPFCDAGESIDDDGVCWSCSRKVR